MISRDQEGEILRLHHAEGWPVGTIAQQLSVHHSVVRRVLSQAGVPITKIARRAGIADAFLPFIRETLEQYPRLCASRLYTMVKARGYRGGPDHFRAIVAQHRPAKATEAYLRLRTLPGEQAQIDWAHFGKFTLGKATRSLMAFVMVLSYSRQIFLRFYLNGAMHNFLRGHVAAFSHFNGVPRVCLYDNLKSAVLQRRGEAIHFHPQLLELAAYYRYQPRPVAPARGNEKGRVERAIRFIRDRFFAARHFRDLDDLNAQALEWACGEAADRPCPEDRARSVRAVYIEEQPRLLALPLDLFPTEERVALSSKKSPYLRFDLNDYSFPHKLVGQTLELVATLSSVRIFNGTTLVAEHVRSFDKAQQIEDPRHIEALVQEKRSAREHRAFDRLHHAATSSAAFFKLAAEHGVHLGVLTRGLLELLDLHGAAALERAMAAALAEKAAHLKAVRHFIDLHQREAGTVPPIAVRLPDDPRLRITVRTHDLRDYEKLTGGSKR